MNHVYRLIWNRVHGMFVPAAELTRANGKRAGAKANKRPDVDGCERSQDDSSRFVAGKAVIGVLASTFLLGSAAHASVATLLDLENVGSSPYTLYTYTYTASLSQTYITFEFQQDPAYWRLDDVSFTAAAAPGNELLLNGGFEGGSYGGQNTPNSWTLIGQAGLSAGGTVSSACAHTGSSCYKDGAVGGVDGLYQSVSTSIGQTYTLSFWLSGDGGGPASAVVQIGDSLDNGGVLVPVPPGPSATDIVSAGSPHLAAGLGSTLNPVFDGGTLQLDASGPTFSQDFTITTSNGTIDTAGLTSTMSGVISGQGGLTFVNTGVGGKVTLTNTNTYTGATTIDAGAQVALSGIGSIAASSGVTDNGTLDISAATAGASISQLSGSGNVELGNKTLTLTNASGTFAGVIHGSGGLSIAGGTETLTGNNTFTGAATIANGAALNLTGIGAVADASGVANNGTFDISGTASGASITALYGSGTVNLGDKALTLSDASSNFSGVITGTGNVSVTAGDQAFSGSNTYTGVTTIAAGATLRVAGTGGIAHSGQIAAYGTLDIAAATNGVSIKTLLGTGTVNLGDKALTLTSAGDEFAGTIAGAGSVNITGGTEILSGNNTYSGGTSIGSGGTLVVSHDEALGNAVGTLSFNDGTLHTTSSFTTARNVTLHGDAALSPDADTVFTANGAITGNGRIYKEGDGTLILAGDNRNWGVRGDSSVAGLTIDGGLVQVTNPYGLGYGQVNVNNGVIQTTVDIVTGQTIAVTGDMTVDTDAATVTNLTGTIASVGSTSCFTKTGAGTLVMSGTALLGQGTCVDQGRLYANGVLDSSVTVASGATLRGTGTIIGAVTVHGTLAPGNSPGTLVANGTVSMASGSTYQEDINGIGTAAGPGNYSRLIVTGAGNQFIAAGSALVPNLTQIIGAVTYRPYVPQIGDTFRVITAEGGIVGRFNLIQPNGMAPDTRFVAFYDVLGSNSVDLRVVPTSYGSYLVSSGGNRNAQSVGGAVDAMLDANDKATSTAAQDALAYQFTALSAANVSSAATALAGEVHGAMAAAAPLADQWLEHSIRQQTSSNAVNGVGPGHAVWMDAVANHSKWAADDAASAFTVNRKQLAVGFDIEAGKTGLVGLGYSTATSDVNAAGGYGSIDSSIGFAYGRYAVHGVILDGIAAYGTNTWKTHRAEPLAATPADLTTESDGHTTLLSTGARLPISAGAATVTPFVRAMWQRSARAAFDEATSAPGSLTVLTGAGYAETGTRFTAGFAVGSQEQNPFAAAFTYQLNLGLAHDSGDLAHPTVHASLAGTEVDIVAPQVSRFSTQGTLGGTARISEQVYVYLGLSGEIRNGESKDEGLNAGFRTRF